MRRAAFPILAALLWLTPSDATAEPVSFSIAQRSARSGASLPRWGKVYLDIAYSADRPVRFQASAFKDGQQASKGQAMNGAVVHPAGQGHALVWVGFFEPAEIDAIRITAYDEEFKPLTALGEPFRVRWSGEKADAAAEPPAWVASLSDEESRLADEYARAHPAPPDPYGEIVVTLMALSAPIYLLVQAFGAFRFRGGWRMAALAPLIVMGPVLAVTVLGLASGSNLWPLLLIFTAPVALLYFLCLFATRLAFAGRAFR